jgi:hypothetical protein
MIHLALNGEFTLDTGRMGENPMIRTTKPLLTAAFGLIMSALVVHTANAQNYKVIFLGTFGGDQTVATGINDLYR